jgi:hypothetical protein
MIGVVCPTRHPRARGSRGHLSSYARPTARRLGTGAAVEVLSGTVQMRLPSDVWIDLEHAANAVDEAEGALRNGEAPRAWSHAAALVSIGRRPFLAGEEAVWIEARPGSCGLCWSRPAYPVEDQCRKWRTGIGRSIRHGNYRARAVPGNRIPASDADARADGQSRRSIARLRQVPRAVPRRAWRRSVAGDGTSGFEILRAGQ